MQMNYMKVIEDIREYEGVSQVELAKVIGITKSTYSNYKRYDRTIPLKHINAVANYFNVSIDFILGLTQTQKYNVKNIALDNFIIGKNIQNFRKEFNITQDSLANNLGTTQSTISDYEKGNTLILTQFLYIICSKYKVSADYLLGKVDSPKYLD